MEIGSTWEGWKVAEFIGRGAFGEVYRIVREEFGYEYESALKVIRIPKSEDEVTAIRREGLTEESITEYFESVVKDIVSEFVMMSRLRGNSNIVSLEDHRVEPVKDGFGWEIFIRMEYLTPLYDYIGTHPLSTRDVIRLGIDICRALEICQAYHIIHRDIKPENIFVSDQGNYKLGDFGVARQLEKTVSELSKKGTFTYMAPEIYKAQPYNASVDIYSLGIVLYRFANNNRSPFQPSFPEPIRYTDKEEANARRMQGEQLPAPCNAGDALAEVILKACAYDPDQRYSSPTEMRLALENVLLSEEGPEPIVALSETPETNDPSVIDAETVALTQNIPFKPSLETDDHAKAGEDAAEKTNPREASAEKWRARAKRPLFWVVIAVVAASLCGIGAVYGYYHHTVPDVVSLEAAAAKASIEDAGLVYSEEGREFSDEIQQGCILSQSIEEGDKVRKGSEVSVVISRGEAIPAPDLKNKSVKKAKKESEAVGLSVEVTKKKFSDTIDKGDVISQKPKAGTDCERGSVIRVVKSKGIEQVKVPDVEGKTREKAESALKKAKLKSEVATAYSSAVASGKVISQSEEAGKKIDKNSTVTITVSAGPAPVVRSSGSSSKSGSGSSSKKSSSGKKKSGGSKSGWGQEF